MSFSLFKLLSLTELFLCLFVCLFSLYIHHLVCIKSCTDFFFFLFCQDTATYCWGGGGGGGRIVVCFPFLLQLRVFSFSINKLDMKKSQHQRSSSLDSELFRSPCIVYKHLKEDNKLV